MPAAAMKTIDHATLAQRIAAGAIFGAHVIGQPGGWGVVVKDGSISRALAARRGSVRLFRRFETLVAYLKRIGLDRFEVDASGYQSESAPRNRPNMPQRTEGADEAADHDRWFRAKVEKTLEGIGRGEVRLVPDDEHRAGWRWKRADLLARVRQGG